MIIQSTRKCRGNRGKHVRSFIPFFGCVSAISAICSLHPAEISRIFWPSNCSQNLRKSVFGHHVLHSQCVNHRLCKLKNQNASDEPKQFSWFWWDLTWRDPQNAKEKCKSNPVFLGKPNGLCPFFCIGFDDNLFPRVLFCQRPHVTGPQCVIERLVKTVWCRRHAVFSGLCLHCGHQGGLNFGDVAYQKLFQMIVGPPRHVDRLVAQQILLLE